MVLSRPLPSPSIWSIPHELQVFDIAGQRVADRALDVVDALIRKFDNLVSDAVDRIGIVARIAHQATSAPLVPFSTSFPLVPVVGVGAAPSSLVMVPTPGLSLMVAPLVALEERR